MATRVSGAQIRRYSSLGTVIGAVALVLGVGSAAYTAGKGGSVPPTRERYKAYVPEFDVVEIPVPERPVPAGTFVRDIKTRVEKFPRHQVPAGVLHDLRGSRDRVTLVSLPGGLPVMAANIGDMNEASNPILGHIPPGMRAMTVKVDATSAVEGWARSGSVVDVLLVEKTRTTVIAEQVRVISAERSLSPVDLGVQGHRGVPSTVTLLVTQEQCLAISTAVPLGKISFALRSSKDDDSWRAHRFSSDEFYDKKPSGRKSHVGGVVSFGEGDESRQYALVDGSWIPADDVPPGFFSNSDVREGSE
jgi:Flp pilus assembly protein CpaB